MIALLEVNVLIALAWPSHVFHDRAHRWFEQQISRSNSTPRFQWATCSLTQNAFVRISSNPAIVDGAVTPGEAVAALRRFTEHPHHVFLNDSPDLSSVAKEAIPDTLMVRHRQVTDTYLLLYARRHEAVPCTFDRRLAHTSAGSEYEHCLRVLPE